MTHDELMELKISHWLRKAYIKDRREFYKNINKELKVLKKRTKAIRKELG